MAVKVPTAFRTSEGLFEGYSHCGIGSQWLKFIEISLKKIYRGKDMAKDSEIWKPMFILDLPYEVDKKFYQTAQSSLQEMDAPMLQSDGDFGWFSTFLKKKNVETTKFEGQSTVAGGKGVDLLRKMAALGVSCKFVVVFGLRLFILIIVSHCCFF